jgi:hypothetical protein
MKTELQMDRARVIQSLRNIAKWMEESPQLKFSEGIEALAKEAARIESLTQGGPKQ